MPVQSHKILKTIPHLIAKAHASQKCYFLTAIIYHYLPNGLTFFGEAFLTPSNWAMHVVEGLQT